MSHFSDSASHPDSVVTNPLDLGVARRQVMRVHFAAEGSPADGVLVPLKGDPGCVTVAEALQLVLAKARRRDGRLPRDAGGVRRLQLDQYTLDGAVNYDDTLDCYAQYPYTDVALALLEWDAARPGSVSVDRPFSAGPAASPDRAPTPPPGESPAVRPPRPLEHVPCPPQGPRTSRSASAPEPIPAAATAAATPSPVDPVCCDLQQRMPPPAGTADPPPLVPAPPQRSLPRRASLSLSTHDDPMACAPAAAAPFRPRSRSRSQSPIVPACVSPLAAAQEALARELAEAFTEAATELQRCEEAGRAAVQFARNDAVSALRREVADALRSAEATPPRANAPVDPPPTAPLQPTAPAQPPTARRARIASQEVQSVAGPVEAAVPVVQPLPSAAFDAGADIDGDCPPGAPAVALTPPPTAPNGGETPDTSSVPDTPSTRASTQASVERDRPAAQPVTPCRFPPLPQHGGPTSAQRAAALDAEEAEAEAAAERAARRALSGGAGLGSQRPQSLPAVEHTARREVEVAEMEARNAIADALRMLALRLAVQNDASYIQAERMVRAGEAKAREELMAQEVKKFSMYRRLCSTGVARLLRG